MSKIPQFGTWIETNYSLLYKVDFKKKSVTSDRLTAMKTSICNVFINKDHEVAINLDTEKAYEMVWRDKFVKKLYDMNKLI